MRISDLEPRPSTSTPLDWPNHYPIVRATRRRSAWHHYYESHMLSARGDNSLVTAGERPVYSRVVADTPDHPIQTIVELDCDEPGDPLDFARVLLGTSSPDPEPPTLFVVVIVRFVESPRGYPGLEAVDRRTRRTRERPDPLPFRQKRRGAPRSLAEGIAR